MNIEFRDMQEQGAFHAGREYERRILAKRIKELEDCLIEIRKSTEIMEARRFAEQALKGE